MTEKCGFYCLSFQNEERKMSMENRFKNLGVDAFIYPGITFDDERIKGRDICDGTKKTWSYTYGHFDLLQKFYDSDKEYGIFCEDDIFIRKDFIEHLPNIINNFKKMNLDVLLLGYLYQYHIDENSNEEFYLKGQKSCEEHPFSYYNSPDFIWGAQMYMLTKEQALKLLNQYSYSYADLTITNKSIEPFSSDFIITKNGNRALIYPMIALEDGKTNYSHYGQQVFHQNCHHNHYVKNLFYE